MKRVVVSGIGLCTPLGHAPEDFFAALCQGKSGIRLHPSLPLGYEVGYVEFDTDRHFSRLQQKFTDRVSQMAVVAALDAVAAAGLSASLGVRAGVYVGTSLGGLTTIEDHYERFFSKRRTHLMVPGAMVSGPSANIAIRLGATGESQTYSSACASSTIALGEAYRRIRDGYIDTAIAGGSESCLQPGIMAAWDVMGVMYRPGSCEEGTGCRPFSRDRMGFALGEGAAIFVLESLEAVLSRGARPICEIVGYGQSCDAHHIINPTVQGQVQAMNAALQDAGLTPSDIAYVNAHGTGTSSGDAAEAQSIAAVFAGLEDYPPVSSTKSSHGHLLGATGAVEFAALALALEQQMLPPTAHWCEADPLVPFDCVAKSGRPPARRMDFAMSNSFGFGGNNAVLVAKRWQ